MASSGVLGTARHGSCAVAAALIWQSRAKEPGLADWVASRRLQPPAAPMPPSVDLLVHQPHEVLQAERTVDQRRWHASGSSPQPTALSGAEAVSSRTLHFSEATWSRVISPELAARCKSSQEAICISLVVSRIDSAA